MMLVRATQDGRVDCRAMLMLPISAARVWGQLRDFRRYASHDYFHADIRVEGGAPRQGAGLRLRHIYWIFRIERIGRILWWREGSGFAFSDLSRRGPRAGFPHIFVLRVEPEGADQSALHIAVRGRWTAQWIPIPLRRLWLRWVFAYVVVQTRNELLAYVAAIRRKGASRLPTQRPTVASSNP